MPNKAVSDHSVVIVVDVMEFRRALMVHFLKEWAVEKGVELIALAPVDAHEMLRDGVACKMILFNAGMATRLGAETIAEVTVLRTLAPSASLVVITDDEVRDDVIAIMKSGADGYLSNQSPPELALRALTFVLEGGTYFPRSVVAPDSFPDTSPLIPFDIPAGSVDDVVAGDGSWRTLLSELSERQRAILSGLCRGEPNKIIGRQLNLPESTVKVHVREIMRKLSVSNRTQVAVVVSRMGSVRADKSGRRNDALQAGEWPSGRPKSRTTANYPELAAEILEPVVTNGVVKTSIDHPLGTFPLDMARPRIGK